jgi:hypothetical protein
MNVHRLYEALQNPQVELRVNCYSHIQRYTKCYIIHNFSKPRVDFVDTLYIECWKIESRDFVFVCACVGSLDIGWVLSAERLCSGLAHCAIETHALCRLSLCVLTATISCSFYLLIRFPTFMAFTWEAGPCLMRFYSHRIFVFYCHILILTVWGLLSSGMWRRVVLCWRDLLFPHLQVYPFLYSPQDLIIGFLIVWRI